MEFDPYLLARWCLKSDLPQRWQHVQGVAAKSRAAGHLFLDDERSLLIAAALLHDIGYSPKIANSGFHPLDGALFLKSIGAPRRLCALVAHHSCAHQEAELRGMSAELAEWSDEGTSLRDALWWADMTTTPDGVSTNVHDRIEEIQERYGPEHVVAFFIRQARTEIVAAVERTEERLRAAGIDYTAK
ncbi:HD domain-containing protein [Lentzea flaviverrucosa]|uniref:HD domain-containing protein n=1 Tax=Lentzea flaviverrucosa TaxID=200379 RepID=UPI000B7F97AE|nr:HD domain-containing protein [Lentzea flaviverrucosa]